MGEKNSDLGHKTSVEPLTTKVIVTGRVPRATAKYILPESETNLLSSTGTWLLLCLLLNLLLSLLMLKEFSKLSVIPGLLLLLSLRLAGCLI